MKRATFKKNSYPKDPDFVQNWARQISLRLFLGFFDKIGISPNKITVINFFTNNLAAVYFFSRGNYIGNLIGLFFCLSSAALDYIDGAIARKRGIKSKLGGWLDATLDFIWQNLLLCAIVYGVFISKEQNILWLIVGFFAIIGVVVSSHMGSEYNRTFGLNLYTDSLGFINRKENKGATFTDKLFVNIITPTNFLFILLFTIRYFIAIGALFNIMNIVLCAIMIFSITKAVVLFYIYILFFQYRDGKKVRHLELIKILDTYYHGIKKRKEI